jgi:hypothetical protein
MSLTNAFSTIIRCVVRRGAPRFSKATSVLSVAALSLVCGAVSPQATEIGQTFEKPCPFGDCSAGIAFTYLGEAVIPTGHMEAGVEFGGISGLDFDEATGRFVALSDDRAENGPARIYELDVGITELGLQDVSVLRHTPLLDPEGKPFAPQSVDPEALRIGADGLYWTSEGGGKQNLPPSVHLSSADGRHLKQLSELEGFAPAGDGASGIRDNLSFESLAKLPSGDLLVALEAALQQDGPKPGMLQGSPARMVQFDAETGEQKAQYVYMISPIPQSGNSAEKAMIGLSEMVSIGDGRLLTVERSFADGAGNTIKIFMVDLLNATDVSDIPSLAEHDGYLSPVLKTEVLDLNGIGLEPDNIEAMAIGKGRDGTEVLLLAADNNFSSRQKTQFFAFKMVRRGQ